MQKPALLIMAAGMGSRFGGLKQITPVGPDGEIILDYSIYDAYVAGFRKVVFVINEKICREFKDLVEASRPEGMEYEYAFQRQTDLPNYSCPPDRSKPWGTGHAVYAARSSIGREPFAVIGSDDFFGRDTFLRLYEFLSAPHKPSEMCMVGFRLENTVTENGSVSRGICTEEGGYLRSVTERTKIERGGDGGLCWREGEDSYPLADDAVVSMNVWGFHGDMFREMEQDLSGFLQRMKDSLHEEYFLPAFVDRQIQEGKASVKMLHTASKWYGITYREDTDSMRDALRAMHEAGEYPKLR